MKKTVTMITTTILQNKNKNDNNSETLLYYYNYYLTSHIITHTNREISLTILNDNNSYDK